MSLSHPVVRTAFYCALIRADDADSDRPVCGDAHAARLVDDAVRRDLAPLLALRKGRRATSPATA